MSPYFPQLCVCQACLSVLVSAVQSTYPCALVHCPAAVSVVGEVEGKITTEKNALRLAV